MIHWDKVTIDLTGEEILRQHIDGYVVGEVRPAPDGQYMWWMESGDVDGNPIAAHGMADTEETAMGIADVMREAAE